MLPLQLQQPDIAIPPDSVIMNRIAENTQQFMSLSGHDKLDAILEATVSIGLKLIAAILVFIVGRWLIRKIDKLIDRIFIRRNIDTSINTFVRNMLRIVAYIVLVMIVISILGIKTTSFVALIASAGFAIGMALSGTLQNFAGGIMILLLKPFRTGDYIAAQGYEGTVKEIKLFSTVIVTADNKTIIIPNGGLSTSIVNNYSEAGTRRIEWVFSISTGNNYDMAKSLLKAFLDRDSRVLEKPPYFIALQALDNGNASIVVRAWSSSNDYWDVFYDMNEKVYKIFPQHGLTIPNPLTVNLNGNAENEKDAKEQESTAADKQVSDAAIDKSLENIDNNEMKSEANSISKEDIDIKDGTPGNNS